MVDQNGNDMRNIDLKSTSAFPCEKLWLAFRLLILTQINIVVPAVFWGYRLYTHIQLGIVCACFTLIIIEI